MDYGYKRKRNGVKLKLILGCTGCLITYRRFFGFFWLKLFESSNYRNALSETYWYLKRKGYEIESVDEVENEYIEYEEC